MIILPVRTSSYLLLSCLVQDLQSILSHVLNDADQKIKDSYEDTLPTDRSPNEEDETPASEEDNTY